MRIIHSGILRFIFTATIVQGIFIMHPLANAQTASVSTGTVYQTMDGFGGQTWAFGDNITGASAALFFSSSSGIGLQYIRTANTWDGGVPDLASLKAAVALGAQVELSLQSPPCSLKHSYVDSSEGCTQSGDADEQPAAFADGSASSNGTCFTSSQALSTSFAAYATYIVNYINMLQNSPNNIPIAVLDVQNEPNIASSSLGACSWGGGGSFQTFVGSYLGPALASANLHPKVMLGSAANWFNYGQDYTSACLNDSTCASYVNFAAGHGYSYPLTPTPYSLGTQNGRHLWMSETGDSSAWDPSMGSALTMATNIHAYLTVANVSAYEWWELAYDSGSGNFGLTDASFNPAKRFYALGNWSKFIKQGWVRIGATATPQSGVSVTAFADKATGAFAIVAINTNQTSVSQNFSLSGLTTNAVTPYITDPSNDLASQATLSVSGNAFSATLTGSSVTTFTGNVAGGAAGSPTNLTGALVH